MGDISESVTYEAGIHEIATTEPLLGGAGGNLNVPLGQLANRTAYLKAEADKLPVTTVGSEGVKQLGNAQQQVTSGGKTTTLAAGTLFSQIVTLLTEFVKHRGTSEAGWAEDHDDRYARAVSTGYGESTWTPSQTKTIWTGAGARPPASALYYLDTGAYYMVGTGPRATDVEVTWDKVNFDLKIKNVGASDITIRHAVYATSSTA